jgi:hypothetical protein
MVRLGPGCRTSYNAEVQTLKTVAVSMLALAAALPAAAQQHHEAAERPALRAIRVDRAPRVDGLLDDELWAAAPPADRFTQQEPREGEPSSERTEVRVVYDARNVYIAVHAYDTVPSAIVATEMRRDSDRLLEEDNFQIILDTFNDQRSGYMFVTTPLGAKLEQQVSDDGEGGGRGSNSAVNRNWDGVWDAAARITDDGWTAEIAIPTSTLRFLRGDEQSWGINFMRNIRRKNEQAYWSPVGRAYTITRVSSAGRLTDVRAVSQGLDLKLKPFVVSGVRDRHTLTADNTSFLRDVGADLRYGLTSGVNLDLTVNTDFAQVEVDEQQVNLTRFGLFFPEKREFFLENAGLFTMGTGQSFSSTPVVTDLFFSRRIGLSDTGQPVPILGGARLAGKAGPHNVAFLDIQTDSAFGKPGDNFLVGRYSRDVLSRSRIGGIFINKESAGGSAHYNRTMGADANLNLGQHFQVMSFLAKTATPGREGQDVAWSGRVTYRDPSWNLWLNYLDVQDNFNPEVGFVQRTGIRTTKAYFGPTPRPGRARIRMMEPMFVLTYITDQQNRMVGRTQHFMVGTRLDDNSYINVIYQRNLDVLDEPFPIRPDVTIPIGSYDYDEWNFSYSTNPAARVYGSVRYEPMEFYGGHRNGASASLGFRASTRFSTEFSYDRNDVELPYGSFLTNLSILRADYAFSPRATIRSLIQHNSSTNEVTSSIRFNFIYRPGSDIYIVYNGLDTTRMLPADRFDAFRPSDRQLVVKFSYLLSR